jgi:hypothetical protein
MMNEVQIKSRSSGRKKRLNLNQHRNRKVKDINQLCLFPLDFTNVNSQEEKHHVPKFKFC